MDNNGYSSISSNIFKEIIEKYENYHDLELDFDDNIINFETKHGAYLINKHFPTQQIWISSPKSGGIHFIWNKDINSWVGTKNEGEIIFFLDKELN